MIAVIPARGGSKGLPGKNIKSFNGKPLIAYTIEAALAAKCIDRVIVTTDSQNIADIARKFGAEVPFLRPEHLASDTASAVDVYLHVAEYMRARGENTDHFMVLLPTAPLRNSRHIDEAYERFVKTKATTLISVKESDTPPSWFLTCDEKGVLANARLTQDKIIANRQENQTYYVPNGAIYILYYKLLKEHRTYYCENTFSYLMDSKSSIDIDLEFDFKIAEFIARGES